MSYITSHNSFKIVNRDNLKDLKLEGEIYKSKITIFSRHEEASLLAVQELMKDPDKYFKNIYNPILAKDTKKYVYKEQQPGYHTYKDCPRLTGEYADSDPLIPREGDPTIPRQSDPSFPR